MVVVVKTTISTISFRNTAPALSADTRSFPTSMPSNSTRTTNGENKGGIMMLYAPAVLLVTTPTNLFPWPSSPENTMSVPNSGLPPIRTNPCTAAPRIQRHSSHPCSSFLVTKTAPILHLQDRPSRQWLGRNVAVARDRVVLLATVLGRLLEAGPAAVVVLSEDIVVGGKDMGLPVSWTQRQLRHPLSAVSQTSAAPSLQRQLRGTVQGRWVDAAVEERAVILRTEAGACTVDKVCGCTYRDVIVGLPLCRQRQTRHPERSSRYQST